VHLSRFNSPAHSIPCIESSGIRQFHEIRWDPRIPVYLAAIGKPSDYTAAGTHSRFTSQDRSYAQSQTVARETFAWDWRPIELAALDHLSIRAFKSKGRFLRRERPEAQWPVKGLLKSLPCERKT
jgi:hypothetical protein